MDQVSAFKSHVKHLVIGILVAITYVGPIQAAELSSQEKETLTFMRQEEKLARDVYLTLSETWGHRVFSNIAASEQRHMDAVGQLLRQYNLPDPISQDNIGEFKDPELQRLYNEFIDRGKRSPKEAFLVGVDIENKDIRDLKKAIEESQNSDLDRVYQNLLYASQRHLAAFSRWR